MARPGTQLKIETFGGMIPAIDARLLPQNHAVETENVWLYDGRLRGMRVPREVHVLDNPSARSVYRIPLAGPLAVNIPTSVWLEFDGLNVSVVRNPTVDTQEHTYYWCGDTPLVAPRYTSLERLTTTPKTADLLLGVPAPTTTISVTPSGGVSSTTETRSYVFTYVSTFGEEGPPSDPTASITGKVDDTWAVTMPDEPTSRGPTQVTITGITQAANGVVTSVGHPYAVGDRIYHQDVVGMTQINGTYSTVTAVAANNYTLDRDTSGYSAYSSGGKATKIQREIAKKRIYRTVTSDQGAAVFFFVAEVDVNVTSYNDTALSEVVALNEQLTSQDYDPPPEDLEGFTVMPNGILIGWRDNELWFSEPYRPHAWPAKYNLHVDFPIVGIGVVGQTAVVCTEGAPYTCTGIRPDAMALSRISSLPYPCVSKGSIVSTPEGVYYAAAIGLILVAPGGTQVATKGMLAQENWQKLITLARLNAAILNGAYYCFSGVGEGCFESTAFETTAFEMLDYSGTMNGAVIEFSDARIAFNLLTSSLPTYNVMQDPWSDEVLIIRGGSVYQIDMTESANEDQYRWKSRIYRMDIPTNLGTGVAFHSKPPRQPYAVATLNVYATPTDDPESMTLIHSINLPPSGQEFRLPAGQLYLFYQFEITTSAISGGPRIECLQFATTSKELRGM